jgi:hypothetical protein
MANTTFNMIIPALKTVDLGDDTYAVGMARVVVPAGGTDTVFRGTIPPLKAIDLGDGTYAISISIQ